MDNSAEPQLDIENSTLSPVREDEADVQKEVAAFQKALVRFTTQLYEEVGPKLFGETTCSWPQEFPTTRDGLFSMIETVAPQALSEFPSGDRKKLIELVESFMGIYEYHTKTTAVQRAVPEALKFVMIGLYFGPDRAIASMIDKDDLWTLFKISNGDSNFKRQFKFEARSSEEEASVKELSSFLVTARETYHDIMRDARFGNPLPVLTSGFKFGSGLGGFAGFNPQAAEPSDPGVGGLTSGSLEFTQHTPGEESPDQGKPGSQPSPTQPSHSQFGAPEAPLSNYTLSWAPSQPLLWEFQDSPEYLQMPKATTSAKVLKTLEEYSVATDGPTAAEALGVSAGVSGGILAAVQEGLEPPGSRKIKIPLPTLKDDRRILTFDFNTKGRSVEEILGTVFLNMNFPNESARQETMRALLQRVIDDPETEKVTLQIALECMDQLDIPRLHHQNTTIAALRTLAIDEEELVEAPLLGSRSLTTPMAKSLLVMLSIGADQKYSVDNPESRLLEYYLRPLAAKITAEQLNEEGAYALLSNLVTGTTADQVRLAWREEKIPFLDFWEILQKVGNKATSGEVFEKALEKTLSSPPEHVGAALVRIKTLRLRIHAQERDREVRTKLIEKETLADFKRLVQSFYPQYAATILHSFDQKLSMWALKSKTHAAFNSKCPEANKINLMMEVICTTISDDLAILGRPRKTYAAMAALTPTPDARPFQDVAPGPAPAVMGSNPTPSLLSGPIRCILCTYRNHVTEECQRYPQAVPTNVECLQCNGRHPGPCLKHVRLGPVRTRSLQKEKNGPDLGKTPWQKRHEPLQ